MKIIASDYDGTFNHNGIGDDKKGAVAMWRKQGNLFGIVSGRGYPSLKDVIDCKPFEYDFLICNNGALICDSDGNAITETKCDGSLAKPFIEDLFKWGCDFANIDKDIPIAIRSERKLCKDGEYVIGDMPFIEYFNQISTYLKTVEEATAIVKKIEKKYSHILTPLQNGTCIDIVPLGVNKATGIYSLLEIVGGNYDDVIAVGDNINDTHMIAEFRSYAMENAVDSIKEIADNIVSDITDIIKAEI